MSKKQSVCLLEEAARYIDDHGWIQGDLRNAKGAVCLVGALRETAGASAWSKLSDSDRTHREAVYHDSFLALGHACGLATSRDHMDVMDYNDHVLPPGPMGKYMAIKTLRNAANLLREGK